MNSSFKNTDQWLTPECLADMAETLTACDFEMLAELREIWPAFALSAACKLLDPDTKARIRGWVLEQNANAPTESVELMKRSL